MISKEDMLLLAVAFVEMVRHGVKFSENMTYVYKEYEGCGFHRNRFKKIQKLIATQEVYSVGAAVTAWEMGVGACDELAAVIFYVSQGVKVGFGSQEKIYVSILAVEKSHVFCVLHQDFQFHQRAKSEQTLNIQNFYQLKNILLDNSIVMDAWINKATPVDMLDSEHRAFVDDYKVPKLYKKKILTLGFSCEVGIATERLPATATKAMGEMLDCFNHYYSKKMKSKNITPSYGKSCAAMQRKLSLYVGLEELEQLLFQNLLQNIDFDTGKTQRFYLKRAQAYILDCIESTGYLTEASFKELLFAILRIAVLIYQEEPPQILSPATLLIASVGEAFLDFLEKVDQSYFSALGRLGLHELRNKVFNVGVSQRPRYWALCNALHSAHIDEFLNSHQNIFLVNDHKDAQSYSQNLSYLANHPLVYLYMPQYINYCYQKLELAIRAQPKGRVLVSL